MRAGELTERFAFEVREDLEPPGDENGTATGAWRHQFLADARLVPLRRGESVLAGRLAGVQPYVMTIHAQPAAARITTAWRCINRRTGQSFNIRTVEPDSVRATIDLLIEAGVADG